MYDLIHDDLVRQYPSVADKVSISLFEASNTILAGFDASLTEYATNKFFRKGIAIRQGFSIFAVIKAHTRTYTKKKKKEEKKKRKRKQKKTKQQQQQKKLFGSIGIEAKKKKKKRKEKEKEKEKEKKWR